MYDSTYQIVRENNQAMQRQLFQGGSFESQNLENKDMDVTLFILSKKKIKKEEICSELKIPRDMVENIIKKLADKRKVSIEPDNETVNAIDFETAKIDSSSNGVGDVSTTGA